MGLVRKFRCRVSFLRLRGPLRELGPSISRAEEILHETGANEAGPTAKAVLASLSMKRVIVLARRLTPTAIP